MEHQHETKNNREQHKINNAPPEPRNRFYCQTRTNTGTLTRRKESHNNNCFQAKDLDLLGAMGIEVVIGS